MLSTMPARTLIPDESSKSSSGISARGTESIAASRSRSGFYSAPPVCAGTDRNAGFPASCRICAMSNDIEVLNFGSLNIDHVYHVSHFVRPQETLAVGGYRKFAGGKGLNQSVALARAGLRVAHAGKCGTDGAFLADTLREAGVDVRFLLRSEGPTGHACIQVDSSGQNAILVAPGANQEITGREVDETLAGIPAGTLLLLQNEINDIPLLMRNAARKGLRIALNPAPCGPEVADYPLELCDFLFVNEVEAAQLTGLAVSDPGLLLDGLVRRCPRSEVIYCLWKQWHNSCRYKFPSPHLNRPVLDCPPK